MKKNFPKIFSMSLILLIMLSVLAGCTNYSNNGKDRGISYLVLNSDGSKLISITGSELHYSPDGNMQRGSDFQIWNISSGKVIWNEYPVFSEKAYFSPKGKYFVMENSDWPKSAEGEIKKMQSGKRIMNYSGVFISWSNDGKKFVTATIDEISNYKKIIIWDAINFSMSHSISIQEVINISIMKSECHLTTSADCNKVVFIEDEDYHIISAINISGNFPIILWENTFPGTHSIDSRSYNFVWSNDRNEVGTFCFSVDEERRLFNLMIWDANNGSLLYVLPGDFYYPDRTLRNIGSNCKKYMFYDYDDCAFKIYNLSGLENIIPYDSEIPSVSAWSQNGNVIAIGNEDGTIRILNASTGKQITILKTPLRKVVHPIPFLSVSTLFVIIFSLTTLKKLTFRRRK